MTSYLYFHCRTPPFPHGFHLTENDSPHPCQFPKDSQVMVPSSILTLSVVLYSSLIQSLPRWPPFARFDLLQGLCIVYSSAGASCLLLSTSFSHSLTPGIYLAADLYSVSLIGLMFSRSCLSPTHFRKTELIRRSWAIS